MITLIMFFCKRVSLTFFQKLFLLFETFDKMLGRHTCLKGSYDFAIHEASSYFSLLI